MSVTHPTAMRNAIADLVVDALDVGGPGKLKFRLSGTAGSPGTAAATLTLFGLSDIVEIQTGAWWQPWWLLVWKGACISGLVLLLWIWYSNHTANEKKAIQERTDTGE